MNICIFDHHIIDHPVAMGGVSKLVEILFEGLASKGYKPTLIAHGSAEGSYHVKGGSFIALSATQIDDLRYGKTPIKKYFSGDIFHSQTSGKHANFDFTGFEGKWVATCQGSDMEDAAAQYLVFVSKSQLLNHCNIFSSHLRCENMFLAYNCFEDGMKYQNGEHDKLIWIGEIRPDKGVHLLPEIAKKIGRAIYIYGPISHPEYFQNHLEPYIGYSIHYKGFLATAQEKNDALSSAELFIHPATFNEPFGMTLVESMICGVPFTGFATGSLPELSPTPQLLAKNLDEICNVIKSGGFKNYSKLCIEHAMQFSAENFINNYANIYNSIISSPYKRAKCEENN